MCIVYYTIYAIFPILMYYDKIYNLGQYFFQSVDDVATYQLIMFFISK